MATYQQLKGHRDLKVYKLATDIFNASKLFPKEEKYSLTDQIRRSSRSIAANIAEGFRKRQYPKMFVSKLAGADGEAAETQVWLDFARDCGYMPPKIQEELTKGYEEVGKMLGAIMSMPEKFLPRTHHSQLTSCFPPSAFLSLLPISAYKSIINLFWRLDATYSRSSRSGEEIRRLHCRKRNIL